ncbi:hypothetical protein [Pedobacter sp. UC225_65]|uniref:hypothetical protein n=1 Tax=Pedobacter sp. UC225_65 TaxID=3350173 RepID=UPI0036705320
MQRNSTALGNAWIVESVQYVKNSDEEMKAISSFDPKKEAIVDQEYKKFIDTTRLGASTYCIYQNGELSSRSFGLFL